MFALSRPLTTPEKEAVDVTDLAAKPEKRKLLSLRKAPDTIHPTKGSPKHFVRDSESIYMVFNPDGHMPKRVYQSSEQSIALSHAKALASEHGKRFYVLRAWRAFEPAE